MSSHVPGQPEYLGPGSPAADSPDDARRGGRRGMVAAVVLAVAASIGAGTYGVVQLLSGGSPAASAVPADAYGFVSLDLDPSAAQKIEAFKMLRKFPALKDQLDVRSTGDLRRSLVEEIVKSTDCADLDYDRDVKPWIGERVGLAAVPDAKHVIAPMAVLQVSDQARAKAGIAALEACSDGDLPTSERAGVSFVGDYLLVAETQRAADALARDAEAASLADDEDYRSWTGRTGGPGIVTMYAAPGAAEAVVAGLDQQNEGDDASADAQTRQLETALKDFKGAAGVVRFADGAVEAEFTTQGLSQGVGAVSGPGPDVATLPGSSAAVFALAFRDGWLVDVVADLRTSLGSRELDGLLRDAEQQTGLRLPEDLETLLGDGASVSLDGAADLGDLAEAPDPAAVPAGLRISGDPAGITAVIDRLKRAAGPDADLVEVRSGDGMVAVGADPAYLDRLLENGDLGTVPAFADVVPNAERATGILYVNFDAGDGLADLLSDGDADVRANVEPLDALGLSGWVDGDRVQHALLRVSTD